MAKSIAQYGKVAALRDANVEQLASAGPDNELLRRARHVVSENERVLAAVSRCRTETWTRSAR